VKRKIKEEMSEV